MVVIIPLSEKTEKKRRLVTATTEIALKPREYKLLKMLAGNQLIKMSDIIDEIFGGKMTYNNKEKVRQLISALRGYGFKISCTRLAGYSCEDEIYIK